MKNKISHNCLSDDIAFPESQFLGGFKRKKKGGSKKKTTKKQQNAEAPVVCLEPEILSSALAATPIRAFQRATWDSIFKRT